MKKYELTHEQLTYLHSVDAVKEQIEDWFPELKKPSLEVGKWYKGESGVLAYCNKINKSSKNSFFGYGFGFSNLKWCNEDDYHWGYQKWTLATPQEVVEALTKEAVKRGFKKGVKFNRVNSVTNKCDNVIDIIKDELRWNGFGLITSCDYIFYNGVWATIIENTLPSDIEQLSLKYGKEALINYLKD